MPTPKPAKPCARCGRPFTWRRKWARDWDQVKYCSDKCRMGRGATEHEAASAAAALAATAPRSGAKPRPGR